MSSTPERGIDLLRVFCRRGPESREFGGWKEILGWEMVTGRVRVADRGADRYRIERHLGEGEFTEEFYDLALVELLGKLVFTHSLFFITCHL